jgi:HTH-type transcriptional regulator / antitoxin HigA
MSTTKIQSPSVGDDYLNLIRSFPLRPIRTRSEHQNAISVLLPLAAKATVKPRSMTSGEEDYYLVLVDLVHQYESPIRRAVANGATPLSRLKHLMDAANMKSKDLAVVIGTRSGASMILSGKRPVSRTQAKMIAERFGVDAGMFL